MSYTMSMIKYVHTHFNKSYRYMYRRHSHMRCRSDGWMIFATKRIVMKKRTRS